MRAVLPRAAVLLATIPMLALTGCSVINSLLDNNSTPPNLTGNWSFAVDPANGSAVLPELIGALAGQGSSVTATLHGDTCIAGSQDINFTGSEDSSGHLTLISTNLPNNTATISASLNSVLGIPSASGSIVITGSGPCATQSVPLIGGEFAAYTGTYSGTLTSSTQVKATVSTTLTQGDANADGKFPETGTLTLTTPSCTDTFNVSGTILRPTATLTFTSAANTPQATATETATLTPTAGSLETTTGLIITSNTCNAGTFTGTLAVQ